jgi:hypothetical protein
MLLFFVQTVQVVQVVQAVQTPSFILPRDAGEERGGDNTPIQKQQPTTNVRPKFAGFWPSILHWDRALMT